MNEDVSHADARANRCRHARGYATRARAAQEDGGKQQRCKERAYAAAGLLAGIWSQRVASVLLPGYVSSISVAAAIGVYSAVASGMIALTAIVFSLTFLMVQFSASIYSPRLVFWVAGDRVMSHALGVFTATFLYALVAHAWVDRGDSGRVPMVGVTIGTALLVASVCMFISLTQRLGNLDVSRVLSSTADRARDVIDRLFPSIDERPSPARVDDRLPCVQIVRHQGRPRSVQAVDVRRLTDLASQAGCVIELAAALGDSVRCRPRASAAPTATLRSSRSGTPSHSARSGRSSRIRSTRSASWSMSRFGRCRQP